jgi:hypothetical protein
MFAVGKIAEAHGVLPMVWSLDALQVLNLGLAGYKLWLRRRGRP